MLIFCGKIFISIAFYLAFNSNPMIYLSTRDSDLNKHLWFDKALYWIKVYSFISISLHSENLWLESRKNGLLQMTHQCTTCVICQSRIQKLVMFILLKLHQWPLVSKSLFMFILEFFSYNSICRIWSHSHFYHFFLY